jgi:hypothetical protein
MKDKTVDLLGRPFAVDWQSPDRRQIATHESGTCYELVSFRCLKSQDDDVLRKALPAKIEKCWIVNPHYERDAPSELAAWRAAEPPAIIPRGPAPRASTKLPSEAEVVDPDHPDAPARYRPPEARGLPVEPDETLKKMEDLPKRLHVQMLVDKIVKLVFQGGRDDPNPLALSRFRPGRAAYKATFENGEILYLRDAVKRDVPDSALEKWEREAQAKAITQTKAQVEAVAEKLESVRQGETESPEPLRPPEVNETILWHFQMKILDELDPKLKSMPSASQVFVLYCRDRMKLAEMQRKLGWPYRTLKARKHSLEVFLRQKYKLKLAAFFVDRRIFAAAERQLKSYKAKYIGRRAVGGCEIDRADDRGDEADG